MTLKKAIEVLTHQTLARIPLGANDQLEAVALSIEAMKLVEYGRYHNMVLTSHPLPGETKE